MTRRLRCSEVWGGVRNEDVDAQSAGIKATLLSLSCDGGKGGDLYYFSVCDDDALTRVVVADVVGHGSAVSAVSEQIYEAMRAHMNDLDGAGVLSEVNRVSGDLGMKALTTAAIAAFYKTNKTLYASYAGHHDLLALRRGELTWSPVALPPSNAAISDLPLGVFPETRYRQEEFPLEPGDRLFLYTDGVIEAQDADGELFGIERLRRVLDRVAWAPLAEIKSAVLEAVREHTRGSLSHDDVTLMVVEVA